MHHGNRRLDTRSRSTPLNVVGERNDSFHGQLLFRSQPARGSRPGVSGTLGDEPVLRLYLTLGSQPVVGVTNCARGLANLLGSAGDAFPFSRFGSLVALPVRKFCAVITSPSEADVQLALSEKPVTNRVPRPAGLSNLRRSICGHLPFLAQFEARPLPVLRVGPGVGQRGEVEGAKRDRLFIRLD